MCLSVSVALSELAQRYTHSNSGPLGKLNVDYVGLRSVAPVTSPMPGQLQGHRTISRKAVLTAKACEDQGL